MNPERKNASDNLKVVKALQCQEKSVFTSKAVYDGRKNLFAPFELPLGSLKRTVRVLRPCLTYLLIFHLQFEVSVADSNTAPQAPGRPPRIFSVTLTRVAIINPESVYQTKLYATHEDAQSARKVQD